MCDFLKKKIEEKYILEGFDSESLPKHINIKRKEDNKQCGELQIEINKEHKLLILHYITTEKCGVKGLGKDILYVLVCKAKEMGLETIEFDAYSERNQTKLEKYYTNLGFKTKGERNNFPTKQAYLTNINTLLHMIKGGGRKTKKRVAKSKRRRTTNGKKK